MTGYFRTHTRLDAPKAIKTRARKLDWIVSYLMCDGGAYLKKTKVASVGQVWKRSEK